MEKLYFDCETTGTQIEQDRIIQLAVVVENEEEEIILDKSTMFNPEIPIKPTATEVHGITDDMVKNSPKFYQFAKGLKKLFENKIIITYNGIHFDIPILLLSFERAGVEVELSGKFIDVYRIEKAIHTRSLANTYKKYTGRDLEGAHGATADVMATKEVFQHQAQQSAFEGYAYTDKFLDRAYELSGSVGMVDHFGRLKRDEYGKLVYGNWGKNKGRRVIDDPAYVEWVIKENFPQQVKKLLVEEINKYNVKKLKLC